jgi:hypothetical protein
MASRFMICFCMNFSICIYNGSVAIATKFERKYRYFLIILLLYTIPCTKLFITLEYVLGTTKKTLFLKLDVQYLVPRPISAVLVYAGN